MTAKQMPKAGDVLTLEKSRHNPDLPWHCPSPEYCSRYVRYNEPCYHMTNEHYTVKFTIKEVIGWADNSIEAYGHLEDGTPYKMMIDGPHGDACY
jgi:hypothetical protein